MTTSSANRTYVTRAPAAPLLLEELRTVGALRDLVPAWERLFSQVDDASPFQSAAWLVPWAELFGGQDLLVFAAWRGAELVGLAPFRQREESEGRTISFLGRGITDYSGFLVAPGPAGEGVVDLFWGRLHELRGVWDLCDLDQIPPTDPAHSSPLPATLVERRMDEDICPILTLPPSTDELVERLPHQMGARSCRYLRRLQREGELRLELANPQDLDELLDAFFRLHTARWQERQLPGVLADDSLRTFHERVAHGMLERGRLRLHGIRLDGQVRAVVYAFAHGKRTYSYLSGFDPALASLSLGTVSVFRALWVAVEEGMSTFDFLRGGEAYKYRWGAVGRPNRRRLLRSAAPDPETPRP